MSESNTSTTKLGGDSAEEPPKNRSRRGFAVMDSCVARELSRRGGIAAHRAGTAHRFSREEARAAGRKGGLAVHAKDPRKDEDA
jgi:general stress protein YciG